MLARFATMAQPCPPNLRVGQARGCCLSVSRGCCLPASYIIDYVSPNTTCIHLSVHLSVTKFSTLVNMSMRFGCNPQINLFKFVSQFELSHFLPQLLPKHIDTGYLVNATPPTSFTPIFFETLQIFMSRPEDVHAIWL